MFKAKTKELGELAKKSPQTIKALETILPEKAIVYIDFANVRGWQKRIGWQVDLRKLKDFCDSFGVAEVRFYFGTYAGDSGSQGFMTFVHRAGYKIRTKPVKRIKASIDVSSISPASPDILHNLISKSLLRELRVEVIEYLNEQLRTMNKAGKLFIEEEKCNFDVEIASDMRVDHILGRTNTFCLWSGDSDFADTVTELLNDKQSVSLFGTARAIASELSKLQAHGLKIFDIKRLREFIEKKP